MIVGLLDPAFFLPRPYTKEKEENLAQELHEIARMCREHNIVVPPFDTYWSELWRTLGGPLERSVRHRDAKEALRQLRLLGETSRSLLQKNPPAGQVWRRGFSQLFQWEPLDETWTQRMANAAVDAALLTNEQVVLFTRRVVGRNVRIHTAQNSKLHENTRWLLHIQPKNIGHRTIICVHHPRNLTERWTTRLDWRLPAESDKARYPFCPPAEWWKAATDAVRTIVSKPAWLDAQDNGWARPNIPDGASYHWDVYVQAPHLKERLGVDQINVVAFGSPPSEGRPGDLHHIPSHKSTRVRDRKWNCPK